jgi:uncharacterized protein (TIGR04255 family)
MNSEPQPRGAVEGRTDSPEFRDPPVIEVVLAVTFRPIPGFRIVHYGQLWERHFKEAFPTVLEQARVQPLIEQLDSPGRGAELTLELAMTPPLPRAWFIGPDASQLVQVQNDWFARNWRKVEADREYPRYPNLRQPFAKDFRQFVDYVRQAVLEPVEPTQCELSYINHIVAPDGLQLSDILTIVQHRPTDDLPSPEAMRLAVQYVIARGDEAVGRLHVTAEPAVRRADGRPVTVLTLTARGRPLSRDLDGVLAFFDLGHEQIVHAFERLTTQRMHELWGRRQ